MKKKTFLFFIVYLILFSFGICQNKINKIMLNQNSDLSVMIKNKERHYYPVDLNENCFISGTLFKKGLNLYISIYDPNGKFITWFDTGDTGKEFFWFSTKLKGRYKIMVGNWNNRTGKYRIKLDKVEPIPDTDNEKIKQLISIYNKPKSPGGAIGIIKNGKIIYKEYFGFSNLEYDVEISAKTIFNIASVSKHFTAYSILLLENRGLISLTDNIIKFFPELEHLNTKITINNLLHHTSGLRDEFYLLIMAGYRDGDIITQNDLLNLIYKQNGLNNIPGEKIYYSNSGYTLLAELVRRVSKMKLDEFTTRFIFQPLKMTNSFFYSDHEKIVKNVAYSYHPQNKGFKKGILNTSAYGHGNLYTNLNDFVKWIINFENKNIFGKKVFCKLKKVSKLKDGKDNYYGMGLNTKPFKGINRLSHSGFDSGFRSHISYFPDQKLGIIIFSNISTMNPKRFAESITNIYLSDQFKIPKKKRKTKKTVQNHQRIDHKNWTPDKKTLIEFSGDYYSNELETKYVIVYNDNKLRIIHWRNEDIILIPDKQKDNFVGDKEWCEKIVFIRNKQNKISHFFLSAGSALNLKFLRKDFRMN